MSYTMHAITMLSITVKCEKCTRLYSYKVRESAQKGIWYQTPTAEERDHCLRDLQSRLDSRLERKDLGFDQCPDCGHTQSWMRGAQERDHRSEQRTNTLVMGCLGTILFVLLGAITDITFKLGRWSIVVVGGIFIGSFFLSRTISGKPKTAGAQPAVVAKSSGPVEVRPEGPTVEVWEEKIVRE